MGILTTREKIKGWSKSRLLLLRRKGHASKKGGWAFTPVQGLSITCHMGACPSILVLEVLVEVLADLDVLEHACQLVYVLRRHANVSEPFHHVFLFLAICRRLQDQASGEMCLVVAHEDIFVLYILQYQ